MSFVFKALLLALYGALCALEFLVEWAKDAVRDRLRGEPEHDEDDDPNE